jgi:hypothetical protein
MAKFMLWHVSKIGRQSAVHAMITRLKGGLSVDFRMNGGLLFHTHHHFSGIT